MLLHNLILGDWFFVWGGAKIPPVATGLVFEAPAIRLVVPYLFFAQV